jgi:hypothetical protein
VVTETTGGSEDDVVKDSFSLGLDKESFDRFIKEVPHAAGGEAGVAVASHVPKDFVRVDSSSSLAVPECPDSGLDAGESFFERLGSQQVSRSITVDPERVSLVVCS